MKSRCMADDFPTISRSKSTRLFSLASSSSSLRCSMILSISSPTLSAFKGFSKKSQAPSFVARTAVAISASPEIMNIFICGKKAISISRAFIPPTPGIFTSKNAISKESFLLFSIASSPEAHVQALCPFFSTTYAKESRIFASSSTIKIFMALAVKFLRLN